MDSLKISRKNADHIRDVMTGVQHEVVGAIIGLTGIEEDCKRGELFLVLNLI
jgi:hypothetical protein